MGNGCGTPRAARPTRPKGPMRLGNRDQTIEAIGQRGLLLGYMTKELQSNKEVVLSAVQNQGEALRFASEELQNDKEVVLAAVGERGAALRYASGSLRGDQEVVLAAVESFADALEHASEELRADRDIVLAAVCSRGGLRELVDVEGEGDTTTSSKFENFGAALRFASDDLRGDEDFVLLCCRACPGTAEAKTCYEKALESLKQERPWDSFWSAKESALAVRGEKAAPVLSVSLTITTSTSTSGPEGASDRLRAGTSLVSGLEETSDCLRAETSLVSGRELVCEVPSGSRPEPIVNDLATKLVKLVQEDPELDGATRIFITFKTSDEEWELVSAWDNDRPLHEYLLKH